MLFRSPPPPPPLTTAMTTGTTGNDPPPPPPINPINPPPPWSPTTGPLTTDPDPPPPPPPLPPISNLFSPRTGQKAKFAKLVEEESKYKSIFELTDPTTYSKRMNVALAQLIAPVCNRKELQEKDVNYFEGNVKLCQDVCALIDQLKLKLQKKCKLMLAKIDYRDSFRESSNNKIGRAHV